MADPGPSKDPHVPSYVLTADRPFAVAVMDFIALWLADAGLEADCRAAEAVARQFEEYRAAVRAGR